MARHRCYCHADLATRGILVLDTARATNPHITAGTFATGFGTKTGPNPDDGRIAEHRGVPDRFSLLQQTGY